ncbi:MAG: hypothetical protein IPP13_00005, partial [Kouleothrix sp.]|nr:hypothetical protein [Kouleothrix sp.]
MAAPADAQLAAAAGGGRRRHSISGRSLRAYPHIARPWEPSVAIYLTDGYGEFLERAPRPVL